MWLFTATINIISLKSDSECLPDPTFENKKIELQELDGNGHTLPGWERSVWADEGRAAWPTDVDSITIKRLWNTEQNARAFFDLVTATFGVHCECTVEEQV